MRARGLVILAVLATFAACSAGAGQGFNGNENGDNDGDAGRRSSGGGGGGGGGGAGTLLPDGGFLLPDGAVISPPKDGGFLGDGAAPTSRISCGSSYCRGDQTCNAGSCQFACSGQNVPGDYATIQAAINANVGVNDLTICLKAQNYPESVSATTSPASPKNLTIIGVSSSVTTINSFTLEYTPFSQVSIRGVAFTSGVVLEYASKPVQFVGTKISTSSSYAVADYGSADVLFDGCDISAANEYGVTFYAEGVSTSVASTQKLTIQNSYIHDSTYGVSLNLSSGGSTPSVPVTLVNDTFNNDGTSIYTSGTSFPVTLTYANNLILNSKTYGVDQEASQETLVAKDNALFGNVNNYAGSAVDGTGYVKADVKLDSTQNPPGLSSGSPARGGADSSMAPATDFWGVARSSSPDIGAVQN